MAKYNKGEFLTIPNKSALRGLSPNLQVLFFWLCDHSDDNMKSFPSRQTLAAECGMGVKTLDRSMQELVRLGYVVKSVRTNKEEHLTNLYEVVIFGGSVNMTPGGSVKKDPRVASNLTPPSVKNDIENSTHLTQPIELNRPKGLVNSDKPSITQPKVELFFYMLVKALGFSETTKFTAGRKAKLVKRLRTYKGSEILKAATNLGANAYMQGENDSGTRYGTIDYLLRCDENVDKYLQVAELKFTEAAF